MARHFIHDRGNIGIYLHTRCLPSYRMKPASQPVHLPTRRGQLTREQQKQKDMNDTVKEFSFGALGMFSVNYCIFYDLTEENIEVNFRKVIEELPLPVK